MSQFIFHNVVTLRPKVNNLLDNFTTLYIASTLSKCRIRCFSKHRIRPGNFPLFLLVQLVILQLVSLTEAKVSITSQFGNSDETEIRATVERQIGGWVDPRDKQAGDSSLFGGDSPLDGEVGSDFDRNAALLEMQNERPKLTLSNALLGALFGCTMFFIAFIIIISVLASIRAVDYYIFGRKDIRKELLNGEDENSDSSSLWKIFSSSSKPSGKSAHHQANSKPQFWKAQMFHVVEMKSIRAGRKSDSQHFRTNQERLVDKTYCYNSAARAYKV